MSNDITLPNEEIFQFYEGTDPQYFSALTGKNLNRPVNQLKENIEAVTLFISEADFAKAGDISNIVEGMVGDLVDDVIGDLDLSGVDGIPVILISEPLGPIDETTSVTPTLQGPPYRNAHASDARVTRRFQVDLAEGDFSNPIYEGDANQDNITTSQLPAETTLKWRYRDETSYGFISKWSQSVEFTTGLAVYIETPVITLEGAPDEVPESPTVTLSAFNVVGGSDTHVSTSYSLKGADKTVLWTSLENTTDKLGITIPESYLEENSSFSLEVIFHGTTYTSSTAIINFTTLEEFSVAGGMEPAGGPGFGSGVYPDPVSLTALGLTGMTGFDDPMSENYGNYQHSDGSILVFIPKFYYRLGNNSAPHYSTYKGNTIEMVGAETYANESAANAAGFTLHRAFIDGGEEKAGFFIDKYINARHPTINTKAISQKNTVPVSLYNSGTYIKTSDISGCDGNLKDALILSKRRGSEFNTASVFMYSALAMMATYLGQVAENATYCAWYDATLTTNFPKGCNDNNLGDTDDSSVTYTTGGDPGNSKKPLTGSGVPFAKTTHNGQSNGVADLNGSMYEVALGITQPGANATDSGRGTNSILFVLKESVKLADITEGFGTGNDAWGTENHLNTLYDTHTTESPLTANTAFRWGNGENPVFYPEQSGAKRALCGVIPKDSNAHDSTGTNLFGKDHFGAYTTKNMFVFCGGSWATTTNAGVFYRHLYNHRTYSYYYFGFRSACYGL